MRLLQSLLCNEFFKILSFIIYDVNLFMMENILKIEIQNYILIDITEGQNLFNTYILDTSYTRVI